jgi:hypothetical protein
MSVKHIDIGKDFSMTPGPRYRADGPYSGQQFREELLQPAFAEYDLVVVDLDTPVGFGASFLEEAFAGLVRSHGLAAVEAKVLFAAVKRAYLLPMIQSDMERADAERASAKSKGGRA